MLIYEDKFSRLRDGTLGYAEFVRETAPLWRAEARHLLQHWRPPSWFTEEDAVQEMLAAACHFVWRWVPGRGTTLMGYVIWNAYDKAKKRLHKERGAKLSGNADGNPSCIPMTFSGMVGTTQNSGVFGVDDSWADTRLDKLLVAEPEGEERLFAAERVERALRACSTALEVTVVEALAQGDSLELVVDRQRARAPRRKHAEVARAVIEAATQVAARVGGEAAMPLRTRGSPRRAVRGNGAAA